MNVLGAGSMDILDPNYNILCCWVNQSFELIGPWGQQSPTCDYSFTPARCNWYLDGNLPVAGGWCVYRRLECMERVKSVLFVDENCVPHVTTYCQTKCFTATLQCGGYQGVGQCPATPPAGCTGATYTYWGGNPGWSLCFRP